MDIQILLEKVSLWLTEWQRNTCCFSTCAGTCLKSTLGVLEKAVPCWVCWLSCNAEVGRWGSQMWCRSSRGSAEKLPAGWGRWGGENAHSRVLRAVTAGPGPGELAEGLGKVWVLRAWCFNTPLCKPNRVPQERAVRWEMLVGVSCSWNVSSAPSTDKVSCQLGERGQYLNSQVPFSQSNLTGWIWS